MAASDRTVRHLRLRAPSAAAATRATLQLEDALRCASLPDVGERVLLVRRLHLGRLPAGLSSQSLSLLIEQRVAAGGEWVHGSEARAAQSNAVFFASRLQAAQVALARRARGLPLDAWHWRLALPGVTVQAPAADFLTQLLTVWLHKPEAAAALPALLAGTQTPTTRAWWQAHLPAEWHARLRPFVPQAVTPGGGSADPQATGAAAHNPEPDAEEETALHSTRTRADDVQHTQHGEADTAVHSQGRHPRKPVASRTPKATRAPDGERAHAVHEAPQPIAFAPSPPAPASPGMPPQRAAGQTGNAWPFDAFATRAGGLLFLWPVLERLGFNNSHAEYPGSWLAPQVLRLALQRLRLPAEDPAWALLASLPQTPVEQLQTHDALVRWWWHACRIHLRRTVRLGLSSLVLRPAWLRWNATHIDVHFRPGSADLRVRSTALDVDPGWVNALQRVLAYHYDHEGEPEGEHGDVREGPPA